MGVHLTDSNHGSEVPANTSDPWSLLGFGPPIGVRLAYVITGDRALAEDLVQDAFVRLAGRLLHLRDPGGFEAYLRRTIVNLANAYFRRGHGSCAPWATSR